MKVICSRERNRSLDEATQRLEALATRHGFGVLGVVAIKAFVGEVDS